jgi:hypothetical protein
MCADIKESVNVFLRYQLSSRFNIQNNSQTIDGHGRQVD